MMDFFKKIMPNFTNKKSFNANNDMLNLYLDRKKKTFIKIKISSESTCQEIHSIYHSEILSQISQNFSKNNFKNDIYLGQGVNSNISLIGGSGSFPKNFNSKDYNFLIINDDNKILELKMKDNDNPIKYMIKPSINLFYLNVGKESRKESRKDSFDSELNSYSINSLGRNRKNNYDSNNNYLSSKIISYDQNNDDVIDNNEESIREGDLLKFSNKKKSFERRKVIIDKKKMIIEKRSKNGK
jgi:hypothetical protein